MTIRNDAPLSELASTTSRREFGRSLTASAVGLFAAPAFPRPQPQREAQHRHDRGGRRGRVEPARRRVREHRRALRRLRAGGRTRRPQAYPQAQQVPDFRRLYDHANDFDAVVVSTTEHTHAFATLPALQLGKHVYCEKPLTHDVWEARVIREAAAKAKVATQMGTQIHAERQLPPRRRARSRPGRSARSARRTSGSAAPGAGNRTRRRRSTTTSSPCDERPAEIVAGPDRASTGTSGSAPRRSGRSTRSTVPGPKWYRWWDFGNGTMSDLGSHWIDLPFWALKLQRPADDRGLRPAAASGDRPGVDAASPTNTSREGPCRR